MLQPVIPAAPTPQRFARWRVMVLSCVTLCLYGVYIVLRDAHLVGRVVGKQRASLPLGLLLTILTVGIFPGVYVVMHAFDLQRHSEATSAAGRQSHLGPLVLAVNVLALLAAIASGGLAIAVSVVLWSFACQLVSRELSLYVPSAA